MIRKSDSLRGKEEKRNLHYLSQYTLPAYTASSQKAGIICSCSCVASAMHSYSLFIKHSPVSLLLFAPKFKTHTSKCYNMSFVCKINILGAFHTLGKKNCNNSLQDTVGPSFHGKFKDKIWHKQSKGKKSSVMRTRGTVLSIKPNKKKGN